MLERLFLEVNFLNLYVLSLIIGGTNTLAKSIRENQLNVVILSVGVDEIDALSNMSIKHRGTQVGFRIFFRILRVPKSQITEVLRKYDEI